MSADPQVWSTAVMPILAPSRLGSAAIVSVASAAAETLITIAADPKHLGARIGLTAVLHTWGSALTQNPHS